MPTHKHNVTYRYNYDDERIGKQFDYLRSFLGEALAGPITATPWLKHVQPFKGVYWNIRRSMEEFRVHIRNVVEDQR